MTQYRNAAGRVVTRSQPDPWLEASRRWERVEPLSPIPAPERDRPTPAPEPDTNEDDADDASEREE